MNSKLRIIFLFSFSLLAIYFLFDTVVITGVAKSRTGQLGKINKICAHDQLPEIAIFGSSVGEIGINAPLIQQQTNKTIYNFSIDGTRFTQYKGLIDELSIKNDKTKLVILSETYFSFARVDALTVLERYLANISNNNVYNSLYSIQPDLVWKCRYVPFYKYTTVSHIFYMSALDGWKRFFGTQPIDSLLGFTPVYRDWELDQDKMLQTVKSFAIEIDSSIVESYKQCIRNLTSKGINVVIIIPPIYSEYSKKITDFGPLRKALAEISKETNCTFWDFTCIAISEHKSYFFNTNHLNNKGAAVFSTILADSINSFTKHLN